MAKSELVALGLVYGAPRHAYALNTIIKDIGLEHWATVSRASIYSTLLRLEKEGCVKVHVAQVGNKPPRKVYAITPKGRKRLREEQAAALCSVQAADTSFNLAVTFLFGMPAGEAIDYCRKRILALKAVLKHIATEDAKFADADMACARIILRSARQHVLAEIEATKELVALLKKRPDYYDRTLEQMNECYNSMASAQRKER